MALITCILSLFILAAAVAPACAVNCYAFPHSRVVKVSNTNELDRAIRASKAGDLIMMASGSYSSVIRGGGYRHLWFENKKGTKKRPITLCGPRSAILDGKDDKNNYVLRIYKSSYINIAGITVQNGLKGIIMQTVDHCKIDSCMVRNFAKEAVHIQYNSHFNIIIRNTILNTGRKSPGNGEGVYLGSDNQRGKDPNTRNHILYNTIGPGVTAEMIDIKEYSSDAIIKGNILDGRDLCGCKYAFSLISVKGNNYQILGNIGKNAKEHMFKVAVTNNRNQGKNNYFSSNKCLGRLRSGFKCVSVPQAMHGLPNRVACGQKTNTRCG
ncbi:hypothetical protein Ndes2526B_g02180 [Nannochloris sp. 'desiccata']|nr:hypothetical protein KSW81_003465 [Chlorella desiccata (nom. nud.)]KAH7622893.1 hypothetical protein NADE_007762 [Chlorella desiccata (nom. nud.)]